MRRCRAPPAPAELPNLIDLIPNPPDPAIRADERAVLDTFDVATAELLAARALQKRVDSKFIAPRAVLPELLALLAGDFELVTSDGVRWGTYETLYFDTTDFALFQAHRRGRRPRHKVRIRHYVERDVCFLETKTKDRWGVTTKHRFARPARTFDLAAGDAATITDAIGATEPLSPVVELRFPRVTLVGVDYGERLTIDLGISASALGVDASFPDAAVIEIKQPRFDARSPGRRAIRVLGIRPQRVSKYCVALAATAQLRGAGVFRPVLRQLGRMSRA